MPRPEASPKFAFLRALMRCDESSRLHSEKRDRPLSPAERAALWGHFLICAPCRCHRRRTEELFERLRREAESESPPAVPEEICRRVERRASREIRSEPPPG